MNKWVGLGRLAQDPETRYAASGKCVAKFTLAVNEGYGEHKTTTFIPIVSWSALAEACGNNLSKGHWVLVEGRIQVRSYDGNDGKKRYVTEIVAQNVEFLEPKKQEEPPAENPFGGQVFPEEEPIPFRG